MKTYNLRECKSGWWLGNFSPSLFKTPDFEVAYKTYLKNSSEPAHHHKLATEFNLVTKGMCTLYFPQRDETVLLYKGEICVVEPGEIVEFKTETNCEMVVVKIPGNGFKDKYLA